MVQWLLFQICRAGSSYGHEQAKKCNYIILIIDAEKAFESKKERRERGWKGGGEKQRETHTKRKRERENLNMEFKNSQEVRNREKLY